MRRFATLLGVLGAGVCVLSACQFFSEDALPSVSSPPASPSVRTVQASAVRPKFQAQRYTASSESDPFNDQRLVLAYQKEWQQAARQGGLLGAELHRKKESLEAFPLESMTLVGHMNAQGRPVALVKVDNFLYPVRLGSHLGQNFGRVVDINERGLSLRELVQDATGTWTQRRVTLALQDKPK